MALPPRSPCARTRSSRDWASAHQRCLPSASPGSICTSARASSLPRAHKSRDGLAPGDGLSPARSPTCKWATFIVSKERRCMNVPSAGGAKRGGRGVEKGCRHFPIGPSLRRGGSRKWTSREDLFEPSPRRAKRAIIIPIMRPRVSAGLGGGRGRH